MPPTTTHDVIFGDALEHLPALPDRSVHLVVTSPPYWSIKGYGGDAREVGRPQTLEGYLDSLARVWRECFRLLHPGCRLAVNIGDQYLRARDHGRYRVLPLGAETTRAGEAAGFDFMGGIVWHKVSTTRTTGGCSLMGSMYFPKDGHVTYEHEDVLLFRKPGKWPRPTAEQKRASELTKEERSLFFRGLWRLAPERQKGHAAMFPLELPLRLVRMYSFAGETVLDPFLGSGTTSLAALRAGRSSIGIELYEGCRSAIESKLGSAAGVRIGAKVT